MRTTARSLLTGGLGVLLLAGCAAPRHEGRVGDDEAGDVDAAVRFLLGHQQADGAWRSQTYAALDDGASLTPLVLVALQGARALVSDQELGEDLERSIDAGTRLLVGMGDDAGIDAGGLGYPVYSAALTLQALARSSNGREETGRAGRAWLELLRSHQLTEGLGWSESDPEYGGWGYARRPPRKPAPGAITPGPVESNLSATRFALSALRAAAVPSSDPAYAAARIFVERCQNLTPGPSTADPELDDGGFFFIYDDPVRNKAGQARPGRDGRSRFRSYGSATADGLLALQALGLPLPHPRRHAARSWLLTRFDAEHHPGDYQPQREPSRDALYFYYAAALASALSAAGSQEVGAGADWRLELRRALRRRQRADGSWRNPLVDVREDDPLVATPLALIGLAATWSSAIDSSSASVPSQ